MSETKDKATEEAAKKKAAEGAAKKKAPRATMKHPEPKFKTSDGQKFASKNLASLHAKTLTNKTVTPLK